jgi:hypothetical protein
MIEARGVGPPHQPIHARGGLSPEGVERRPQHLRAEMVEERGEPLFLPSVPCGLPYALQRLGHACPVLRPARALLARIPLGLRPSLHRLRNRSPALFVGFIATMAGTDFSPASIIGFGASPSRCGPSTPIDGHRRDLPVPAQGASAPARVFDHAGPVGHSHHAPARVACRHDYGVGARPGVMFLSRLHGWPMRSPADASPPPSRTTTHGSGSMWIATPSS